MRAFKRIAFTLGIIAVIYAGLSFFYFPQVADQKVRAALTQAGFDVALLPKPQAGLGLILYQNVNFDKDGFSQAVAIRAAYDPVSLMISGTFNDLEIGGLSLIGEWDDETFSAVSFAGWKYAGSLPLGAFRHINIVNSAIGMQSQRAGGFTINFDLDARHGSDGKVNFQAHIKTEQPSLTLDGGAHGELDNSGENLAVSGDVDLQDGRFEAAGGKIKSSRMNGSGNISAAAQGSILKFSGDARAGGLWLYGLAWQDAVIHTELSGADGPKISVQAKASGAPDVDLDMTARKDAVSGKISAGKISSLAAYFKGVAGFEPVAADLASMKKDSSGAMTFSADVATKKINYEINAEGGAAKSGQIQLP